MTLFYLDLSLIFRPMKMVSSTSLSIPVSRILSILANLASLMSESALSLPETCHPQ